MSVNGDFRIILSLEPLLRSPLTMCKGCGINVSNGTHSQYCEWLSLGRLWQHSRNLSSVNGKIFKSHTLFLRQCDERFHNADKITFKVGSSLESAAATPNMFGLDPIAACIKTATTLDSDKVCLLVLSAFHARFRNRCAVAFNKLSGEQEANWATIIGTKPVNEHRKLLILALPNVKLVKATTA